ncbi:hypothetical protein ACIPJ2_17655 [Curtobacterium sp. NPDC090217]|uniref:hypothetical protein n=1 Tax=Curtobacterium sp. NPDC090217 TaxID=3363970 RepID=UPI00380DE9F9
MNALPLRRLAWNPRTVDPDLIPLLIVPGHLGGDTLQLRFPPEYAREILQLLDEHEIEHGTVLELSATTVDWIEEVHVLGTAVAGAGGLTGLADVITAFVRRHDKKRFVFKRGSAEIDATGYSRKDMEKLLAELPDEKARLKDETRKRLSE